MGGLFDRITSEESRRRKEEAERQRRQDAERARREEDLRAALRDAERRLAPVAQEAVRSRNALIRHWLPILRTHTEDIKRLCYPFQTLPSIRRAPNETSNISGWQLRATVGHQDRVWYEYQDMSFEYAYKMDSYSLPAKCDITQSWELLIHSTMYDFAHAREIIKSQFANLYDADAVAKRCDEIVTRLERIEGAFRVKIRFDHDLVVHWVKKNRSGLGGRLVDNSESEEWYCNLNEDELLLLLQDKVSSRIRQ